MFVILVKMASPSPAHIVGGEGKKQKRRQEERSKRARKKERKMEMGSQNELHTVPQFINI